MFENLKKALHKEVPEEKTEEPTDQLDDVGQNPGVANPVRMEDNVSTQSADAIAPTDELSIETEEQATERTGGPANDPYNSADDLGKVA
jgi:hypothetical protein